tara:strand:- start:2525 stop:3061 length:537 start_codon:yes stop_codon:yes gene_type:complete
MTQALTIRRYQPRDAAAIAALFHAAVQATPNSDYSAAQRTAWSAAPFDPDRYHSKATQPTYKVWVAVNVSHTPVGFIELEVDQATPDQTRQDQAGHIDCFYRHPDWHGCGVGPALYATLEAEARKQGLTRLYLEASEAARRFCLSKGFTDLGRRDFVRRDFAGRGVAMHNYAMEKPLI